MRYEVIMKSDTDYRIWDDETKSWVLYVTAQDQDASYTFSTREQAFLYLEKLTQSA